MSKLDAAVAQLVNKSASGDLAALRQLMALAGAVENQTTDEAQNTFTEADDKVVQNLLKRIESISREKKDND